MCCFQCFAGPLDIDLQISQYDSISVIGLAKGKDLRQDAAAPRAR